MVENFEKRTKIEWMHEIEREICIEKKLSIAWASNLCELKSWSEYVSVDGGRRAVLFTAFATCLFILSIYSFKSHSKYCVQHRIVLVWFGMSPMLLFSKCAWKHTDKTLQSMWSWRDTTTTAPAPTTTK